MSTVTTTDLPGLNLLSKGKVRDIYLTSDPDQLLFVATDRVSAYDVVLRNGIPGKGKLLTELSLFWFARLAYIVPNHVISASLSAMPTEVRTHAPSASLLDGRAMLVRRAEVVPIEAIVRGYLAGSAWVEYQKSGTVHGMAMPVGMLESQRFPQPIFTPSTKADQGQHDENLSRDQAIELIGAELYTQISSISLRLYKEAAAYAESRGLILADTKFEFGLVHSTSSLAPASAAATGASNKVLILVDELLTPDSSRYWPQAGYHPGRAQPSFDKQFLRDWLVRAGFRKGLEGGREGQEGWVIDEEVVEETRQRYVEVVQILTDSAAK